MSEISKIIYLLLIIIIFYYIISQNSKERRFIMKYTGKYTSQISFPLGGIGTGCIGLSGNGSLRDIEIKNRANN